MKNLLKDKRILIAGAVALVIVLLGGFLLLGKNTPSETPSDDSTTQAPIPTITADELGLTLVPGSGGKTVIATVENTDGVTALEYELSYNSEGDIPRGAIGEFDLSKKPVKKEITLGTCSDTCHYDANVTDIKLIVKVTKDGKVFQSEVTLASLDE